MNNLKKTKKKENKGYMILEILLCLFIFSVLLSVLSVFLKRSVLIEKGKVKEQKIEENMIFIFDRILEDISDRERIPFSHAKEIENIHIEGNRLLIYRKYNSFYKIEYSKGKLYISEGNNILNMGGKNLIGEVDDLIFQKIDELLVITVKIGNVEKIRIISLK